MSYAPSPSPYAPPSTKDAVIFIIDCSPTMLKTYTSDNTQSSSPSSSSSAPSSSVSSSRLTSAIKATHLMISSLMLRSEVHEVAIVLMGTSTTSNCIATTITADTDNAEGDQKGSSYDNVVELNELLRPSSGLLRKLEDIRIRQGFDPTVYDSDDSDDDDYDDNNNTNNNDDNRDDNDNDSDNDKDKCKGHASDSGSDGHSSESDNEAYNIFSNAANKSRATHPKTKSTKSAREKKYEPITPQTTMLHPLSVSSDFVPALIVASDMLYKRTSKKRYNRKIYLLTDGESRVDLEGKSLELSLCLNGIKSMGVQLSVIGLDFAEAQVKLNMNMNMSVADNSKTDENSNPDQENENENGNDNDSGSDGSYDSDSGEEDITPEMIQSENQKVLLSIASATGGTVTPASSTIKLMKVAGLNPIPKSTKKRCVIHVAPGVRLEGVYSLLVKKANLSTLKTHAVMLDEGGDEIIDYLGNNIFTDVTRDTSMRDYEHHSVEVEVDSRTKAYRYGNDYVPVNSYDEESLKIHSDIEMSVLGYMDEDEVPMACYIDGYLLSAGESNRTSVALASLSAGLKETGKVAVTRFVKQPDADPLLGVLIPSKYANKLIWLQVPFAEDFTRFTFRSFHQKESTKSMKTAANNLVDSMMLEEDEVNSEKIANPAVWILNRTLIERVVNPSSKDIVNVRDGEEESMLTPRRVVEGEMEVSVREFWGAHKVGKVKGGEGGWKKKRYWSDVAPTPATTAMTIPTMT